MQRGTTVGCAQASRCVRSRWPRAAAARRARRCGRTRAGEAEVEKGPHGGRLLEDGALRARARDLRDAACRPSSAPGRTGRGAPIAPAERAARGGAAPLRRPHADRIGFAPARRLPARRRDGRRAALLRRRTVRARRGGEHASSSRRTRTTRVASRSSSCEATRASASRSRARRDRASTLVLNGRIEPDEDRTAHVMPRFPGVVRSSAQAARRRGRARTRSLAVDREQREPAALRGALAHRRHGDRRRTSSPGEFVVDRRASSSVVADLGRVWVDLDVLPPRLRAAARRPARCASTRATARRRSRRASATSRRSARRTTQTLLARAVLPESPTALAARSLRHRRASRSSDAVRRSRCAASALQRLRDWDVVFLADGDVFEAQPVELGRRDGDVDVEIVSGLTAGQRYVADGQLRPQGRGREVRRQPRPLRRRAMLEAHRSLRRSRARWARARATALVAAARRLELSRGCRSTRCPTSPTSRCRSTPRRRAISPLEVEQRITFPIETALGGLPRARVHALALALRPLAGDGRLRGRHRHLLRAPARQRAPAARRRRSLPAGRRARAGPDRDRPRRDLHVDGRGRARRADEPTASRGRRPTCARSRTGSSSRSCAPCRASPRSTRIGGFVKQFHVTPRPERLVAYGLTLPTTCSTRSRATTRTSAPATSSTTASSTWSARRARSRRSTTSAEIVVGTPRRRADPRARRRRGRRSASELRTGAATENGREVVLGTVFMLIGENSRAVSQRVAAKLAEVNRSAAARASRRGPSTTAPSSSTRTIATVQTNLRRGRAARDRRAVRCCSATCARRSSPRS